MRVLKKFMAITMLVALVMGTISTNSPVLAADSATDLLFSEYIEGSSNNKALEIYNGTGADVSLDAYTVVLYSNANTDPGNTASLSGTLTDGDVFVIANASADPAILAESDMESTVNYFNGNDCLVLYKDYDSETKTGTVVDSIGKIGGNIYYEANGVDLLDNTLTRKTLVGDTDPTDDYDPSLDWESHDNNDFSFLGSHSVDSGEPEEPTDPEEPGDPTYTNLMTIKEARAVADDTVVTVEGILTSIDGKTFIEVADDPINSIEGAGINLYNCDLTTVSVGDRLKVEGTKTTYYDLEEIENGKVVELISSGNDLPLQTLTAADLDPATHEAERVVMKNVTVISLDDHGTYTCNDGTGDFLVDPKADGSDTWVEVGKTYTSVTGILNYEYGSLELMPVFVSDLVEAPLYPGAVSITEARASADGLELITVGIVTYNGSRIFIQENDEDKAGINLYKGSMDGVNVGDQIAVKGTKATFNGLDELENFTVESVLATGLSLPEESVVTPLTFNEADYEGELVVVYDVTITAQGSFGDYTAIDALGNEIQIDPQDSSLDDFLTVGDTYDEIHGITMMHYGDLEIMPIAESGIVLSDSTTPSDDYYAGTEGLEGEALKAKLNDIITEGHTPVTYSEAYSALETTDEDPNTSGNIILFYKGISVPAQTDGQRLSGDGDIWNREHVWAKSHGDFGTATGPGSDLHQLRPTDASVNSSRGHLDFDESDNPLTEAPANSIDSDSFEPRDEVKGDVARILFYMATRYEGEDYLDLELSNSLDSVSATTSGYGEHGVLDTLLAWHQADPVDAFELARNTKVQNEQGNRNPYIDHPEFVALIWGESDGETPVDPPVGESIDISLARQGAVGDSVQVQGVVTFDEKDTLIYIQDDTAGIKLDTYGTGVSLGSYNMGDLITVKGQLDTFNGELEISVTSADDITLDGSSDLPDAQDVTIPDLENGDLQASIVTLPEFKITGIGSYNIDAVDAEGNTTAIYHAKADGFDASNYAEGDWYQVTGIAAWYNNDQIKLRDPADLVKVEAPANPDAGKPVISGVYPADMSSVYETSVEVSFTIEADENPIDENTLVIKHNGNVISGSLVDGRVSVTLPGLSLGNQYMEVSVADTAGLIASAEWFFTVTEDTDYDFYFGIPHSHSSFSDGKGTPREAFNYAISNGLDWMFLTDHSNWFDGVAYEANTSLLADESSEFYQADYDTTFEYNSSTNQFEGVAGSEWTRIGETVTSFNDAYDDFVAFRGFEMTFGDVGHINVIDSENYVEAKSQMRSLTDFYEWIDKLSETQDDLALASFNHPNWPSDSFYNQAYVPELDEEMSMMEVGNGAPPYSYARAEEQYIRALDNGWHLAPTNGQDNHSMNWGDPDNLTAVVAKDLTEDGIKEAISNRRVYSTETRNLELTVKANGFWMGSVVNVNQGDTLSFDIQATDLEEPIKELVIITNGGNILDSKSFVSPVTTATWNPEIVVPGGANWYMVKVIHANGKWGTAAPIFTPEADKDVKFTQLVVNPDITLPGFETELRATVSNMGLHQVNDVEVSFYVDAIDPGNLVGTTSVEAIPAGESANLSINWTPVNDGETLIIAKMTEIPGVTTVTEISKTITVVPENGKSILIDGSHGNYDTPGGIGEFISLMRQYGYQVDISSGEITSAALSSYDVFVATQPRGGAYTSTEASAIADFAANGGGVFLSGKSNYSDEPTRFNTILEAMNSGIRFNDDNVYEPEDSEFYNGGMVWSVYSYNLPDAPSGLNENMEAIRMFSSGSLTDELNQPLVNDPSSGLEILLGGNASSYNYAVGKQTGGGYMYNPEGSLDGEAIPMIAKEEIGSGHVVTAGRHFYSDFEIGNDVSNTALTLQLMDYLADYDRIMTIQEVRDGFEAGLLVEGDTVTVKGSAIVDEETLFDVIYVQDETSGISLYGSYQDNPADVFEGTEVIATGTIEIFEGEMELAYKTYETQVLYIGFDEVRLPALMSSSDAMASDVMGTLIKTGGQITAINEAGSYMMIDDGSGPAYIHVDGYVGVTMSDFNVGDWVDVMGIGSHGANGPRIRVRYASDILLGEKPFTGSEAAVMATKEVVYRDKTSNLIFTLDVAKATDINAIDFTFTYDPTVMTFKKASNAEGFDGFLKAVDTDGSVRVIGNYIDPVSSEDGASIIKLTFAIVESDQPIVDGLVSLINVDMVEAGQSAMSDVVITADSAVTEIIADKYDLNHDGAFNLVDLSFATSAYQGAEGDDNWDMIKYADINNDKVIDSIDFSLIIRQLFKR